MNPNADHLKHLSPGQLQRLEQSLKEFKHHWRPTALSKTMAELAADHPLRYPLLVEMTRIDLAGRWQHGQPLTLEKYLESYPELGSVHTVSVDLIRAEYAARKANGDAVEVEEYARRFPNQYQAFRRSIKAAPSPVIAALDAPKPAPRPTRPAARPTPAAGPAPKRRARWPRVVAASLLLLLATFLGWMGYKGGFSDPKKFFADLFGARAGSTAPQATAPVQSLTVKLDIGPGADVQEPIYLDLGLGFPLWLVAGGSLPPPVPFGAVPQQTTANGKLPAGSSTTFTFLAAGDPGQDVLGTTPQLLAGLKVGDIRRVGFASLVQQDWELAGFEIQVNGQTLLSAKGLNVRPRQLQDEAMKKLAALNQKAAPIDQERDQLRSLVQTGLASDAEKARLKELEQQLAAAPSPDERKLLARQLKGQSPWFVEPVPGAPAPAVTAARSVNVFDLLTPRAQAVEAAGPPPRLVRVTVVTDASSSQTDTSNYVYFITGGKKYLLGHPQRPLTSANGPQTILLDLLAGPLDSSDLHDFGLGMLAPPLSRGKGPDRWHPVRVQVDVDGKTVYDSEQVPTDRQTLAAIRLVPPSQLDVDGSVVKNPSNSRELYVWKAGQATGFDPTTGNLNPLPAGTISKNGFKDPVAAVIPGPGGPPADPNDPNAPAGPGQPPDPLAPAGVPPSPPPDPLAPAGVPPSPPPDFSANAGQFPGEIPQAPVDPPQPPGGPGNDQPPGGPGNDQPPGGPGNDQPPMDPNNGQPNIVGPVIENGHVEPPPPPPGGGGGALPPPPGGGAGGIPLPPPGGGGGIVPVPNPAVPSINTVELVQLGPIASPSCTVNITWTISSADDSGVEHYEVFLLGLKDDLSGSKDPSTGTLKIGGDVPGGLGLKPYTQLSTTVDATFILGSRFVQAFVKAVPKPPSSGPPATAFMGFGRARSTASLQGAFIDASWTLTSATSAPPGLAINREPLFTTHTAIDMNLGANPATIVPFDPTKRQVVTLSLTDTNLPPNAAPKTIRFYTGFAGGPTSNTMEYRVEAFATEASVGSAAATTIPLTSVSVPGVTVDPTTGFFTVNGAQAPAPGSMHAVSVDMSALTSKIQASSKQWTIELTVTLRNITGDPAHPPVVFDAVILK